MKPLRIGILSCVTVLAVSLAGWAIAAGAGAPVASDDAPATLATCQADGTALLLEPLGKGGGKPGGSACCDPSLEPGTNGNPFCFEGHTCCSDGSWGCNNPDGSPSCKAGSVCPAGCGSRGDSCSDGSDCCSGTCGKNGRCR